MKESVIGKSVSSMVAPSCASGSTSRFGVKRNAQWIREKRSPGFLRDCISLRQTRIAIVAAPESNKRIVQLTNIEWILHQLFPVTLIDEGRAPFLGNCAPKPIGTTSHA